MYDVNDNLIKTANGKEIKDIQTSTNTLQHKQTIDNTQKEGKNTQNLHKNLKKPHKQKIYYHNNTRKIETILNIDEKGSIISNQTYNRAGELTSETIFKDSIPTTKTIYNNSRKKIIINYNMFGSFANAKEFDEYDKVKSIIRDVRQHMRITDSPIAYERIEYLSGGGKIKSEYDSKGTKLTQSEYNINNKLIKTIHIKPETNNNNINSNLFNLLKHH